MEGSCIANQETKECRTAQIPKPKKTSTKTNNKKMPENKKSRNVTIQIPEKPRSVKIPLKL